MRKEQTELFSNNFVEIPHEEINYNGRIIHQLVDPLEILLEEKPIKRQKKLLKLCGIAPIAQTK